MPRTSRDVANIYMESEDFDDGIEERFKRDEECRSSRLYKAMKFQRFDDYNSSSSNMSNRVLIASQNIPTRKLYIRKQYKSRRELLVIQEYVLHNSLLDNDLALKQKIYHWDGGTVKILLDRMAKEARVQSC